MFSKKNKQANNHSEKEIVAQVGSVPARSKKKPNLKIVIPIVVVVILLLIIGLSVLANQVASKTGIPVSVKVYDLALRMPSRLQASGIAR